MPTQIELSLTSLLPTISFLPPELIALSNSLLAQSRHKAASLKPEEEAARTYVCCHIACERLGNRLALDIGRPRPPVKPRVYDKLKTYFNAALRATAPSTPRNRRVEDKVGNVGGGASTSVAASPMTPVTAVETAGTPSSARKRTATGTVKRAAAPLDTDTPKFVMPLIRHLCKEYEVAEAVPHVFAGVCSVLTARQADQPSAKRRKTSRPGDGSIQDDTSDVAAVVTTLFGMTYRRMHGDDLLRDSADFEELMTSATEYCRSHAGRLGLGHDIDLAMDVHRLAEGHQAEWEAMEWFSNVPAVEAGEEVAALGDGMDVDDDLQIPRAARPAKTPLRRKEKHARRPSGRDDPGAAGLLPGLGTMFQPAIDWLSDERRADFAQWKHAILSQLEGVA